MDVFNNPGELDQVLKEIEQITELIISELSEEEALPILCGASVALHTAEYWYYNKEKWIDALGEEYAKTRGWFDWGDLCGDDVSGAIGGAIGGAVAGAMAGGVGAGPGALVGGISGGVGTSATNAAKQIWNYFF